MANTRADVGPIGELPTFGNSQVPQSPDINSYSDRMMAREAGAAGETSSRLFEGLSSRLGNYADQAAHYEGTQAGQVAGMDPNYRPNADESIRGRAFNQAAQATYLNNVDAQSKSAASTVYDQYMALPPAQRQPQLLQQNLQKVQDDFTKNHLFPEIQGEFTTKFAGTSLALMQGANRDLEKNVHDQAQASLITNLNATSDLGHRIAAQGIDETTPQVQQSLTDYGGTVDQAVAAGTLDPQKGVELKRDYQQSLLSTGAKARFDQLPDADKANYARIYLGQGAPGVDALHAAIVGQESGGKPNVGDSVDGAKGPGQITPATFAAYARPGESIDNPQDNLAVSKRIIADLSQKYGGDPARVAVGYFSGTGNVAPAGSATPWLRDSEDGNHKHVSAYVDDVMKRLALPSAMNPQTYNEVGSYMQGQLRGIDSQAEAATRGAISDLAEVHKTLMAGLDPGDPAMQRLGQQYGSSTDPKVGYAWAQVQATRAMATGFRGLGPDRIQAEIDAQKASLGDGATPFQRDQLKTAEEYVTKLRGDLSTDMIGRAVAERIVPAGAGQPLNPADPNLGASLRARAVAVQQASDHYGQPGDFFRKGEGAMFAQGLASSAQPLGAVAGASTLSAMTQDEGFRKGLIANSRSGDPVRMNASFQAMKAIADASPMQFEGLFGKEAAASMSAWDVFAGTRPAPEAAKLVMALNDPSQAAGRKYKDEAADQALKTVDGSAVLKMFAERSALNPVNWVRGVSPGAPVSTQDVPQGSIDGLRSDYAEAYKTYFAIDGNPDAAKAHALESLQRSWGVSAVDGGRLMRYPPEATYPTVDGGHDYIARQLDADVKAHASDQLTGTAEGDQRAAMAEYAAPRALVSDAGTKADIAAGRPASYRVVAQDASGQFHALEQSPGVPLRFFADAKAAQAEADAKFTQQRASAAAAGDASDASRRASGGATGPM
jgi:hypothetical protein